MSTSNPPKTWLITGCSSGFGNLFIPAVVARGDQVVATARNVQSLSEFIGRDQVKVMQLDVTASQDILNQKVAEAESLFGQIDVLVNNAGYVASGVWEEVTHEQAMDQFATNFFGPMNLTRAVLPHFRNRRSGTLIFMSSIAAWHGGAAGGLYSSSKFALEGAVECLEQEAALFNVTTHLIVLGQFRTSILDPSRLQKPSTKGIKEYQKLTEGLVSRHKATHGKQPGDPTQAVERIIDIVKREGSISKHGALPLRIALGSDAVGVMRAKCNKTLQNVTDYEHLSNTTDFQVVEDVPSYWNA